jgi:cyclase
MRKSYTFPGRLLAAALAFGVRQAAAQVAPDTVLRKDVLANGVYLFRASSDLDKWTATNSVVIVNDDDVVVFDSNTRAVTARKVIAEIRKITPKPVRTLINSHWHQDHWSGNDEYQKAFPGLRIIATTETRDYMKRMTNAFFAEKLTGEFGAEVRSVPHVLPNMVYRDSLNFWSGDREFRLMSVTGDATGSSVLYLPREKVLLMGDVLVRPETGDGPPPWTTNSFAITPWLVSLRHLEALDANVIVPGQGEAFRDKRYLKLTGDLWASIIDQVHGILERGFQPLSEVQKLVNVDSIGRLYSPGTAAPTPEFQQLVSALVRKVHQESLDGVSRP